MRIRLQVFCTFLIESQSMNVIHVFLINGLRWVMLFLLSCNNLTHFSSHFLGIKRLQFKRKCYI